MFNRASQLREARSRDDKGFTLIELLVVVVIIGILIAIAIPLYLNYQKGAKDKSAQSDLRNAIATLEVCNADNGSYPSALGTASGSSYPSMTGCSGQTINFTSGTTLTYTPASGNVSYVMTSYNSGGTPKYYCYNSTKAGSISTVSSASATC